MTFLEGHHTETLFSEPAIALALGRRLASANRPASSQPKIPSRIQRPFWSESRPSFLTIIFSLALAAALTFAALGAAWLLSDL